MRSKLAWVLISMYKQLSKLIYFEVYASACALINVCGSKLKLTLLLFPGKTFSNVNYG